MDTYHYLILFRGYISGSILFVFCMILIMVYNLIFKPCLAVNV